MAETTATEVTFEDGYDELKRIVGRLDDDEVTVHEMCDLFARGKGLEAALRGYLSTQQGKLDEIEAGEDLPRFTIVAPAAPDRDEPGTARDISISTDDFAPAPVRPTAPTDDDIPF
jgi:exodeoxyribonuclease VII small subunit